MSKGTLLIVLDVDYDQAAQDLDELRLTLAALRDDVAFRVLQAGPMRIQTGDVSTFLLPINPEHIAGMFHTAAKALKPDGG